MKQRALFLGALVLLAAVGMAVLRRVGSGDALRGSSSAGGVHPERGQADAPDAPRPEGDTLPGAQAGPSTSTPLAAFPEEGRRSAGTRGFTVRVLDASGAPIPGVRVTPWSRGVSGEPAFTDESGDATCAGDEVPEGLLVEADGRPLHIESLEAPASPYTLRLDTGEQVAGVVRVDGSRAAPGLALKLSSEVPSFEWARIPPAVLGDLQERKVFPHELSASVGEDGTFAFRGLPRDWRGSLVFPTGYLIRGVRGGGTAELAHIVRFDGPRTDLSIDLLQLPAVTGRVVSQGNGGGLAGVEVGLHLRFGGSDLQSSAWCTSGADGRFSAPIGFDDPRATELWGGAGAHPRLDFVFASLAMARLDPPPFDGPTRVEGSFQAGGSRSSIPKHRANLTVVPDAMPGPFDLGDLAFPDVRRLRFRALDASGNPIAGALGHIGGFSAPTDLDGKGQVEVFERYRESLMVGAPGYAISYVEFQGDTPEPVEVTLGKATRLEVRVATPAGVERDHLQLVLTAEEGLVSGGEPRALELLAHLGASRMDLPFPGGSGPSNQLSFPLGSGGPVWIPDLVPQQVAVRIEGRLRGTIHTEPSIQLRAGEFHQLAIDLGPVIRDIEARVIDSGGRPIPGARVSLGREEEATKLHRESTADGWVRFEQVGASKAELFASCPGFASIHFPSLVLPENGALQPLVMHAAREARVLVVDPRGRLLEAESVSAHAPGWMIPKALWRDDGSYLQSGLPRDPVTIRVRLAGRDYEGVLDVDASEVRIDVPEHASLVVDYSGLDWNTDAVTRIHLRDEKRLVEFYRVPADGAAPGGRVRFGALRAGTYSVVVFRAEGPRSGWIEHPTKLRFEVEAGESLELQWSP